MELFWLAYYEIGRDTEFWVHGILIALAGNGSLCLRFHYTFLFSFEFLDE